MRISLNWVNILVCCRAGDFSMSCVGRKFWGKIAARHRGCYARSNMSYKVENDAQVIFTIFYVFWSYFVYLDHIMWIVVITLYISVQVARKLTYADHQCRGTSL